MNNIKKIFAMMLLMLMITVNVSNAEGLFSITVKINVEKIGDFNGRELKLWRISETEIEESKKDILIKSLENQKESDLNKKYGNVVVKTIEDNKAIFNGLEKGTYYIREDYSKKRNKYITPFIANISSDINDNSNNLDVYSKKITTVVKIVKVDKSKNRLMGAEFKLFSKRENELVEIKDKDNNELVFTTDDNGEIVITGLDLGDYILKEIKAPEGYKKLNNDVLFSLNKKYVEIEVVNEKENPKKGRQEFVKTDENKNVLEGAVFKVMTKKDDKYYPVIKNGKDYIVESGKNGSFSVENMDFGTYYLVEIKAPKGYELLSDSIKFVISEDNDSLNTVSVIFIKNKKIPPHVPLIPDTGDVRYMLVIVAGIVLYVLGRKIIKYDKKSIK